MPPTDYVAQATTEIRSTPADIWNALTEPERIQKYMFGTRVETDWNVGNPIAWKGEWQGKQYEDKGKVLVFDPERELSYSHYSPLTGAPDVPENYHTVTIELTPGGDETKVTLTQDNNDTEEARDHSQQNWSIMLQALKEHVEAED